MGIELGLNITREFLDALAKLASDDQKRVRETLSKLGQERSRAGLRTHPVGAFLSLSAGMDMRILAVKAGSELTLVHVDHHDAAYAWGERHVPIVYHDQVFALANLESLDSAPTVTALAGTSSIARFSGLPPTVAAWLSSIGEEDSLLEAIGALAPEFAEIALGAAVSPPPGEAPSNVVVLNNDEILEQALHLPAEAWLLFLHPRQRHVVEMPNDRHVLVRGGPGTGKTVCLVHRYARLRREAATAEGLPPAFVALTRANRLVVRTMLRHLGIEIDDGSLLVADDLGRGQSALERSLRGYGAVLVDEGQDLPTAVIANLLALLEADASLPPLMIAFDANQAIVNPTGDALARLVGFTDTVTLTYCFRSTGQIVGAARELLSRLEDGYVGKDFKAKHALSGSRDHVSSAFGSALSGPEVTRLETLPSELGATVARLLTGLRGRYPVEQLAVIVAASEQATGTSVLDPFLALADGVAVLRPIDAKGREFRAGVVVDLVEPRPAAPFDEPVSVTPARYRALSGLYVGLTRFREEVALVMSQSAPNGSVG
jgi:hypothetical protein